jgi:hypothetical protein
MGGETVTNHGHTKCSRPPHCLWLGCSKRMLSFRADYDNSALDKCNSAPLQCLISCFALCRASCRYSSLQICYPTCDHGLSAIVYVRASRVRQAEITCSAYAPPHYDDITACSLCQLDVDSSRPPKTHSVHTQADQKSWRTSLQKTPARAPSQTQQQLRTLHRAPRRLAHPQRSHRMIAPSSRPS